MRLTPNRRMAAFLEEQEQKQDVLAINIWLEKLYTELTTNRSQSSAYLLNSHEEEVVWEKIINQSDTGQSLLATSGTARLARDAFVLSKQWQVLHWDEKWQTEDSRVYQGWVDEYQALCRNKNWVDSVTFIDQLIEAVSKKQLTLPKEIILIGFEELTPQIILLFQKMKEMGVIINTQSLVEARGQLGLVEAKDYETELRMAAHVIKHKHAENPQSYIGLVVPELEKNRQMVVRICGEILPIGSFNVAAPLPLVHFPLIDAAFLALALPLGQISIEKFSKILRSPFLNEMERMASAAILDVAIREFGESAFTLNNLIKKIEYVIQHKLKIDGSYWLDRLNNLMISVKSFQGKQSTHYWCDLIGQVLDLLGWPGQRTLNSEEFQIKNQWKKLLADYQSMENVLEEHSYSEMISYLSHLASETSFLPASNKVSIQILGLLEATGIPFDFLWVSGMHQEAWPTNPAPNPFIPSVVQRTYDLPRSSAARELKIAKKFTEKLCLGAKEVIFSYPLTLEERECRVSSLLQHLPKIPEALLNLPPVLSQLESLSQIKINQLSLSEQAPPLKEEEKLRGGTRLLKLQALCPFRSFAEVRLKADPIPILQVGLSGSERGEVIHQVLQLFWEDIPNQDVLKEFSVEALQHRIHICVESILNDWAIKRPHTLTPNYLSLEKKRVFQLIEQVIEIEKKRPFFEIIAREEEKEINLEAFNIKIRIDRIDKLPNEGEVLIDYKTGLTSISHWFGERPRDPQLPLYCITRHPKPIGLIFTVIRPESIKYQGLARDEEIIQGVKTIKQVRSLGSEENWEAQCVSWQQSLQKLASEFRKGDASVDPLDGENTCRTCSLMSLCRVHTQHTHDN